MNSNLVLKQNIEKYKNNEIDINDIVVGDDNKSKIYSLKDDFLDIKYLFEIAKGFIDRNFLFTEIFAYNTKEKKELKKLLNLFVDEGKLIEHFYHFGSFIEETENIILNLLPLLPEDWLKNNMSFCNENFNILGIKSKKIRKLYFEELKKNGMSKNDMIEDLVYGMNYYLLNKEYFNTSTIKNLIDTINLIDSYDNNFFKIFEKVTFDDFKGKGLLRFFDFSIKKTMNIDLLSNYINFISSKISESKISLKEILRPNIRDLSVDLFMFEPVIFEIILTNFKDNNEKDYLFELFLTAKKINKNTEFDFMNNSEYFIKNKNHLFLMIAEIEKEKILNNLSIKNSNINTNKRL